MINDTPLNAAAYEAVNEINAGLAAIFPGRQCVASVRNLLGASIYVRLNMLKEGEIAPMNIDLNAPGYSTFMASLSDDFGNDLKMGDQIEMTGGYYAIPFRKIKAKSPSEIAKKFLKWAEKNAAMYIAMNP